MAKMAAVMGVPNSPEKAADMPHMTMILRSFSSRWIFLPTQAPMEPPSWRAAPSRPSPTPPTRWVRMVDRKMRGRCADGWARPPGPPSAPDLVPRSRSIPLQR